MTREMKYHSVNNSYTVNKKGKPAYSSTGFLVCVILPVVCSLLITFSLFMNSTSFNTVIDSISYNSTMKQPSYTVKIKEDENYNNKTELPSDMKYVSSLIESINPTFKYDFHATDILEVSYDYTIASKYVIIDYGDEKTPLTEDNIVNLATVSKTENTASVQVNETVSIDFQKYAKDALDYKQTLRVPAIGKLYVYMTLHISAQKKGLDKKYEDTLTQEIEIPLTDAITEIKKNKSSLDKQDFLQSTSAFTVKNVPLFILVVILFELDLYLIYRLFKEYKKYKNRDLYTSIVSKILKDYDRVIVRGKLDIDESKYTNIIYPETFEQLVDASVNEGSPILYYNVLPGQKCFFVIIQGDTLYKFRITRWYVDQNGHA